MKRLAILLLLTSTCQTFAQEPPSYARHVRPFIAKYCLECHNAKALKAGLNLESFKALMEGSDRGPVVVVGKPEESSLIVLIEGKTKPVMPPKTAKFHPKPKEIALVRAWVKAGAKDDSNLIKVVIPDIKPSQPVAGPVSSVAYDSAGRSLAIGKHRLLQIVDLKRGVVTEHTQPGIITALAYGPKDAVLAIAHGSPGASGSIVVRAGGGSEQTLANIHQDAILDIDFAPDGKLLATCSYDTQIKLTTLGSTNMPTRTLKEHSDAVFAVAFSPDGKLLASCSADRALKVWDVEAAKLLYTLGESTDWLYTLAWRPDGQQLACAGVDRSIRIYKVGPSQGKIVKSVFAHEAAVQKVVYSLDGKTLFSLGQDGVVKAWDAERMVETKTFACLPDTGLCLAVRSGEIAVGRYDGVAQILDAATGKVLHELGGPKAKLNRRLRQVSADLPAPEVLKMTPGEARRGQSVRLIFEGKNLERTTAIVTTQEGVTSRIVSATATKVEADVVFPKTTSAGVYDVRVKHGAETSKGLPLIVDPFAKLVGAEGHSSPGTGQPVKLPVSVVGKLVKAGDVDYYRFDVAKGQQLGVHLLTKAVGSKIDAYLQLADLRGKILAESTEGVLGHTFAEAGTYALAVRDRDFRGGADMHYRLHLGAIPVITSIFPLGLQHGTEADVHVSGVFLARDTLRVRVPKDAEPGSKITVPVTSALGAPLGKREITAGAFPEVSSGSIPVPGTANGRLLPGRPHETWKFKAKKGERLVVETNARRLGSDLDSILEILDAAGNPVPRAVLRCQAKTYVTFRDHDSASANIRIEAWGELSVNDDLYVGGELMRILSLPTHPDADCIFFNANGQRRGFLDTTPTHHSMNEPMYKVTLHPPGSAFPPNGYPVFTLFYRNDDGGPGYGRDSRILFDPPADGDYQVRLVDARGQVGDGFGYRLTVRPPRPSFNVRFAPTAPMIPRGGALPIQISADRLDGYEGPINLRFDKLPPGFSAPPTTIEVGQHSTSVALFADEDAPSPKAPLRLLAEAKVGTDVLRKEVVSGVPQTTDAGEIVAFTEQMELTVRPGSQAKLTVHIERRQGFLGRVPLEVRGLPHGVRVLDIGLNGILVNANEVRRTIVIYAEPWVEGLAHPIVILAKREGKNSEHAAKSVMLRVADK